jgi:hypothetical protein
VEEVTEIAQGIGVGLPSFQTCRAAQQRAFAFQASPQEQLFQGLMILLKQELFIAKERFQLEVCHHKELLEKGPRHLVDLCDVRHFPVDTLIQPSAADDIDTGLGI